MELERVVQHLGRLDVTRPYYPFNAAVKKGILPPMDEIRDSFVNPPGIDIAQGFIPDAKHAGVVNLGNEIGGFDHASIAIEADELIIEPTSKNDVTKEGRITEEGAIILARESGRIKIAAFAIDLSFQPSRLDAFRREGFYFMNRVGKLAILSTAMMNIPEFELTDINAETGIIRARARKTMR